MSPATRVSRVNSRGRGRGTRGRGIYTAVPLFPSRDPKMKDSFETEEEFRSVSGLRGYSYILHFDWYERKLYLE